MAHTAQSVAGLFPTQGIAGVLHTIRARHAEASRRDRAYRQTLEQLSAMTDSDLADIGITRFMIRDVAADAARRA